MRIRIWLIGLLFLLSSIEVLFSKSIWQFERQHLGLASVVKGWDLGYQIGAIHMGMEEQISLLLVYNPTNEEKTGLLSGQWLIPQLESSVTPLGKEVMKWVQPGGDTQLFTPDSKDKGNCSTTNKDWRMTFKSNKVILIFNEQGWVYVYQNGVLISVESPTGRALNFIYNRGDLLRVELTDADGMTKPVILVACTYDEEHRCIQMEIGPLLHKFVYEKKPGGRLVGWDQPNGQSMNFYYNDAGVLSEVERAR
jgi:YD repeat-containing protein